MLKAGRGRVAGAMSGTSLDGVDVAVIETDGERLFGIGESRFVPYTAAQRQVLRAALGRWPGDDLAAAAEIIQSVHARALAGMDGVELVGFHGQTLAHEPRGRGTHQLGDGAGLAEVLGLPVVWDFRSADVRDGGEGAPLAPFYHFALARWLGAAAPLAILNLGGVGNLTWIDPRQAAPEAPGALLAFDTGPANAPIDDLMQARHGLDRDEGGALAARGTVDAGTVGDFLTSSHFSRPPPKSLDRNEFSQLEDAVAGLADADAAATLTACAAAAVVAGLDQCPAPATRVLVAGGGRHNRTLMERIAGRCGCPVAPVEDAGLDGDMLEAQAFAFLAMRVARGLPTSCPGTTGVAAPVCGGTVSQP